MSTAAARRGRRYSAHRAAHRRRRMLAVAGALVLIVLVVSSLRLQHTGRQLPLSYPDIIRQQAADKRLDPALIAAVIFAETKFYPRTSAAGAEGLMQILPSTADFLARRSGGIRFATSDLATPSVNVAYGSYYLRYLLDRYRGDEMLAVAAYNAGLANVDDWLAAARAAGRTLTVHGIPYAETRAYVERVLRAQREYRVEYPVELGID